MVVLKFVPAFSFDGLQAICVLGGQHGSVEVADLVLLAGKEPLRLEYQLAGGARRTVSRAAR